MPPTEGQVLRSPSRWPNVVAVLNLLLAIAVLVIVADGACRPEPVPVSDPVDPPARPVTDAQLKALDRGEVAP
jgi:hypothetical protein